ncbi:hypothetical protein ACNOYE_23815 [Nannocystaceae bacterium ST9]
MLARLARVAALALLAASSPACVHRGASWVGEPGEAIEATAFGVVAIAQPRPGRASREVARALDSLLARERAAGRTTLVIWLGHDFGPPGSDRLRAEGCPTRSPWLAPGMRELATTLREHQRSGGAIWGLPGPDGWRCPTIDLAAAPTIDPPDAAYLIRVYADGRSELASQCLAERCTIAATHEAEPARLELVFIDPSAWVYPELDRPDSPAHAALTELDALLAALAERDDDVPRVLVSPIPIESAGLHGYGGGRARSALRWQPESVRRAIGEGRFVGVIAGLERDLQASRDLSGAIMRSDRSFLAAPVFQLVSGAAGGARPTLAVSRGNTLVNELESDHTGFARLIVEAESVRLELHARVGGRWQVGALALPLRPEPADELRPVPAIQPCLRCDPVRGAADGEAWFDR